MKVTSMKLWPADKGKMVGSGWIELDKELEIRVTIFKSQDGGCFASLPSKKVTNEEGDKWYPDVKMHKDAKAELDKQVTAWFESGRKKPATAPATTPAAKESAKQGLSSIGDLPEW